MAPTPACQLEQTILCPSCNGSGWARFRGRKKDAIAICSMCEGRGVLVIDAVRTFALPPMKPPRNASVE